MEESILTNRSYIKLECLIHLFLRAVILDESKIETFETHHTIVLRVIQLLENDGKAFNIVIFMPFAYNCSNFNEKLEM